MSLPSQRFSSLLLFDSLNLTLGVGPGFISDTPKGRPPCLPKRVFRKLPEDAKLQLLQQQLLLLLLLVLLLMLLCDAQRCSAVCDAQLLQ